MNITTQPYRNGWIFEIAHTPTGIKRTAVKAPHRVEQGDHPYVDLMDALDRLDGRHVLRDYLSGLDVGLTSELAQLPIRHDTQGYPIGDRRTAFEPPTPEPTPAPATQPALFGCF
jgi:hypothetical protein